MKYFIIFFTIVPKLSFRRMPEIFSMDLHLQADFPVLYYNRNYIDFGGQIMTNQRAMQIRKIYGIALSAMLAVAGICLMAACCKIYYTGDGTFSREIVAAHFASIAIPVYLCLAMVIGSIVLEIFLPGTVKKTVPEKNDALILQRLQRKVDLPACDASLVAKVLKEQQARFCHKIVTVVLLVIGSVIFLAYALNGNNFHQREITDSLIQAMYLLIPCMAVPFGYAVFAAYHSRASIRREIEILKQAASSNSPAPAAAAANSDKAIVIARWALVIVAVAILVYGYFAGGTADVLTKAINICTECVGLG